MKSSHVSALVMMLMAAGCSNSGARNSPRNLASAIRVVTLPAQPSPLELDLRKTAVIVVDMQNDFVLAGGLLDAIGIDVTGIQKIVEPTRKMLEVSREACIPIVYVKMGYRPDLSDIGSEDSPMGVENRRARVGETMRAPDGRNGRYLVRDTWNTDIVNELKPQANDTVLYKTRYSGFYNTDLDAALKQLGVRTLIISGCTTSVCVESTIRDAMFRDYTPVLLSDCTAEPLGQELTRTNHEASLFLIQAAPFGYVATSEDFAIALKTQK
jgi:ureidoacrylate peracid hydrolase